MCECRARTALGRAGNRVFVGAWTIGDGDLRHFKVYRGKEGHEDGPKEYLRLRQGVADVHRRAQIGEKINERYAEALANVEERKPLAVALRPIYRAASAEAALTALDAFECGPWGLQFPTVVAAWRRAWTLVIPFFAFPPEVRRVIYTTNALESVNARLRKIIKTRGHFPTDEAATKLLWLALRNITATWVRGARTWKAAMNQFAILYEDRFTAPKA